MPVQQTTTTKSITHLPERPAINIEFQDLTYSVPVGRGSKVILKNINGNFKPGQLTAILGPSGAGKSTLLNVLAGFKCTGASGMISVNGCPRDMKQFSRISCYIMQEDIPQPFLTVEECMLITAELKLSLELSREDKLIAITEILDMLNLLKHKHTTTNLLSGGEKKRLSIALELVNNPPVIFLDEPTTGLDDNAGLQCISLLKVLAQGGRNVICSIHTPSAKIFALFDHVYILSEGLCVFQGVGSDIVPFLSNVGLRCPIHYNPADFIMDVASGEYGCYLDKLVTLTSNIRISGNICKNIDTQPEILSAQTYDTTYFNNDMPDYNCGTWKQFKIILHRMFLQRMRDGFTMMMLVLMYIFLAVIHALLFQNVGMNASLLFSQFGLLYNTMIVHMYCPMLEPLLYFPMQLQLVKREHFNRWYHLRAYFWARTVFIIPNQIVLSCIFTIIVFSVTTMPLEIEKMAKFILIGLLLALISDTIGFCIATAMNIVNGMYFTQILTSPLVCLAAYGWGFDHIPSLTLMLIRSNYLRYGVEGLVNAAFENLDKIPCPHSSTFCMYTYRKDVMKFYKIENTDYWMDVIVLLVFLVSIKALSLFMLHQRLSPNKTIANLKVFVVFIKNSVSKR